MGRSSTARDRLLSSACELMHTRGYAAIGVAEICARADVRKGSFYHFFPSKQALTAAMVDGHWQAQRAVWQERLAAPGSAAQRLERLVTWLAGVQREGWKTNGRVDGCLLGNLAVELSNQEPDIQRRLAGIFEEQAALIHAVLTEGAPDGSTAADRAGLPTARAVVAQIEGAVLLAKLAGDPAGLDALWPTVRHLTARSPAPV